MSAMALQLKLGYHEGGHEAVNNQIRVVVFNVPQLTQASFLQKNQTLQNIFCYL